MVDLRNQAQGLLNRIDKIGVAPGQRFNTIGDPSLPGCRQAAFKGLPGSLPSLLEIPALLNRSLLRRTVGKNLSPEIRAEMD